jgi:imidazolonepropionase-like amidohydrolase/Tol biopolymer transport system component
MTKRLVALSFLMLTTAPAAYAQDNPAWDINAPPVATRQVSVDVTEGTWMNVDVSPDGQTVLFDLLGDLYTMPITGGAPTRIASGMAVEHQARYSPDGRRIVFSSDRSGAENLWIMDADGSNSRQLTHESFFLVSGADWSPDGNYIIARKHRPTGRGLGTGEIWMYHVDGGAGVALVETPNATHQKELGEVVYAPDGAGIYFSLDVTPGPIFEYAQNANQEVFVIERYDVATGERTRIAGGPGGAARPTPSPDGRYVAFIRRELGETRLFLRDMQTGAERRIYDDLDRDMQSSWAYYGVYPGMSWTPDSGSVVFWAGGKIRRINVDGSGSAEIPFHISDTREIVEAYRPVIDAWSDEFTTRFPRFAHVSPDGRRVVFESLGRLYVKDVNGGEPRLLTAPDSDFQVFPNWSRDGRRIVFVSWNDQRLGEIRTVSAEGRDMRTVTSEPGYYRRPRFSPDGQTIVFERGRASDHDARNRNNFLFADRGGTAMGVFTVPARGGEAVRLAASGRLPHFGQTSDRVYFSSVEGWTGRLSSVDLSGNDRRVHAEGEYLSDFQVSPTGEHVAFIENHATRVAPFVSGARTLRLDAGRAVFASRQASSESGRYINWSGDGARLGWTVGPEFFSRTLTDILTAPDTATPAVSLAVRAVADRPRQLLALTGARVVTMADAEGGIIDDAVILIEDNRILQVGARADVTVPANAVVVDMVGKTIIPGMIDAHAHGAEGLDELIPQQNWDAISHLALGVTTINNPNSPSSLTYPAAELQRTGRVLTPRTFTTGETLAGRRSMTRALINNLDDALMHVRRVKAEGGRSVKNDAQPRRDQRQQLIVAAIREGMPVQYCLPSLFPFFVAAIADGNTNIEHGIGMEVLYEDVLSYFGQSNTGYTPTNVNDYVGLGSETYWKQEGDALEHPLVVANAPDVVLRAEFSRTTHAEHHEYTDGDIAREAMRLGQRGVPVSIGAHGVQQGIASHWEMWSFARGGMTPIEALATATRNPATALGLRDVGTIEAGKLADMVILDADPTVDIRNSDDIHRVMLNGRIYDPITMNEDITGSWERAPYHWE